MNLREHLLTIVAEECAEISHRCTKALRFGLDEVQTGQTLTSASRIYQEYADLHAAMELLRSEYPAMTDNLPSFGFMVDMKATRIAAFLKYSIERGTLSDPPKKSKPKRKFERPTKKVKR